MATNKNATIRYQALDKCFRNTGRKYAISDLIEACNHALLEYNPQSNGIKRRQVYEDIRFMKSSQGYNIDLVIEKQGRKAFYRYADVNFSINNQKLNEFEAIQLKEALLTLNRIKGLPQFGWIEELAIKLEKEYNIQETTREIIGFESNPYLKGLEYLGILFNAIQYKKVIVIGYQSFKNDEIEAIQMHPQFLKQYRNRWYVLGTNSKHNPVTTLAIDRIQYIHELPEEHAYETSEINFTEWYEDVIGVRRNQEAVLKKIVLKASKNLSSYILTSPLHGSQKRITQDENGSLTFSIEVEPNYELEQQILSFGEELKVLEPLEFREKIKNRIFKNYQNYL